MSITGKKGKVRMNREINYSIIIPHKNIPELLQRCLNSIPRRDDVQIIVVDDNSDSNKVDFEHFPGLGNPCMEIVFTKEGKGAGYARNVGLTKAIGKWLLFADADDYYTDGFLKCLDKYMDSSYDLIYFGMHGIDAKTKQKNRFDRYYQKRMYDTINNKNYDAYIYTSTSPCAKIIKLSLVRENGIVFDETMVFNDVMFSIKTAYYAKNIFFDEHRIYTYELGHSSLTSIRTPKTNFERLYVFVQVNVFLRSIMKKKYQKNLIILLILLIDIRTMKYFFKGIKLIKENSINLCIEFLEFCLSIPGLSRKILLYIYYWLEIEYCRIRKKNMPLI